MKFLVIMAHQRSGTHMLGAFLQSHPAIKYAGELFYHHKPQNDEELSRAIDRVASGNRAEVLCVDAKYNQITPITVEWMARPEVKVIHLVRQNVLRLYFSGALHGYRNQNPGSTDVPVFQFDLEVFDAIRDEIETLKRRLGWLTDLKLYYEELTQNENIYVLPFRASEMICLLAHVPHLSLTGPYGKEAPTDFMAHLDGVPEDLRQLYG